MCTVGYAGAGRDDLDLLLAAAERLRNRPPSDRTPEEIRKQLIQLRHICDLLELEFSLDAARFADTDECEHEGSLSPADWIRHNCRMSGHAAASAVCVGEQAVSLPRSVDAMSRGRIGFGHLALLASTARAVTASSTARGFDEEPLLSKAVEHSVSRFRHDCAHARHAADAEGYLAEHVDSVKARSLKLVPLEGEGLIIRGFLDDVGGATLRTALEPLARKSGADDFRDRERRLADALIELAGHCLDHGLVSEGRSCRPHLQVTTTLETLMGLAGAPAGELEFSAPIPTAAVQRLACDAGITRVLLGPGSKVIDVGRTRRVPAGSTLQALKLRDKGCVWPGGCSRPAAWTQAHHLRHWAHHGKTELPNLVLLCGRHHWKVHEGGWQLVRGESDQRLLAMPPLHEFRATARAPDTTEAA